MSFSVETATVFRGGGRRWFTRGAALNAEAKMLYRQATTKNDRCECDYVDHEGFGRIDDPCKYHDHESRIFTRYVRFAVRQIMKGTP